MTTLLLTYVLKLLRGLQLQVINNIKWRRFMLLKYQFFSYKHKFIIHDTCRSPINVNIHFDEISLSILGFFEPSILIAFHLFLHIHSIPPWLQNSEQHWKLLLQSLLFPMNAGLGSWKSRYNPPAHLLKAKQFFEQRSDFSKQMWFFSSQEVLFDWRSFSLQSISSFSFLQLIISSHSKLSGPKPLSPQEKTFRLIDIVNLYISFTVKKFYIKYKGKQLFIVSPSCNNSCKR